MQLRKQLVQKVRSVVVKVGTAVLTGDNGQLDKRLIGRLAGQLAELSQRGIKVTLVTSGAVGAGMGIAGLPRRPKLLPMLQASAAIGQPALMTLYSKNLAKVGIHAGQILVTRNDFEQRCRYVNISNTIAALHRLNALPIINENDTVAIDELDRFADNDTISALVCNLLKADLLIILTVVDGLLDGQGRCVDLVPRVDTQVQGLVKSTKSVLGSGGMVSKLKSMSLVTNAGGCAIIANGREPNVLTRILEGQRLGTFFASASKKMSARDRWLAGAVRPAGKVVVDAGAAEAIARNGKSLLARGITQVIGEFARGAVIRIVAPNGNPIAHGMCNYNHQELTRIKGLKSADIPAALGRDITDEAIHRDNMVIIAGTNTR